MSDEPQYPPTWPGVMGAEQRPGMTITGKLVDARVANGRNNKQFVIVDLQKADGVVESVPAWHFTLNDLLNEIQPQLGTELTIEFEGTKTLNNGNTLRLYKVNGRSGQGGRKPSWMAGGNPQPDPAVQTPAPSMAHQLQQDAVQAVPGPAGVPAEPAGLPF